MTQEKRTRSKSHARPSSSNDAYHYKTQGMIFGNLEPVVYDKRIDPPPMACFNCWSLNHMRKFCTEPFRLNYCCNCGRTGLTIERCPRCAKPFQEVNKSMRSWIYKKFLNIESDSVDEKKQTKKMNDCKDNVEKNSPNDDYGKNHERKSKLEEYKDEEFDWEPTKSYHNRKSFFTEPNDLFSNMRAKKMADEFEKDEINNTPVNLDETRMANNDSFDENSIVTTESLLKKDDVLRLTGEPIQDVMNLLKAVEHFPVETQNIIILQIMSERKKKLLDNEMKFKVANKNKSS